MTIKDGKKYSFRKFFLNQTTRFFTMSGFFILVSKLDLL